MIRESQWHKKIILIESINGTCQTNLQMMDVSLSSDSDSNDEYNVGSDGNLCMIDENHIFDYDNTEDVTKRATNFVSFPEEPIYQSLNNEKNSQASKQVPKYSGTHYQNYKDHACQQIR